MTDLQDLAVESKNMLREVLAYVPAHNEADHPLVIRVEELIAKLEAAVQNELENCTTATEPPKPSKKQRKAQTRKT